MTRVIGKAPDLRKHLRSIRDERTRQLNQAVADAEKPLP